MSNFEEEFLERYLNLGLGSMPKSDIDALVMHLLDTYGLDGSPPLAKYSNQTVSERLKTPVAKVKRLRYEAALKFGNRIEDEAKGRLLAALSRASLEPDDEKIRLIIEDSLAKNWLQGQLKVHQQIFDHSFNREILTVSADGLFEVLETVFDKDVLKVFREGYAEAFGKEKAHERRKTFSSVAKKFAEGAAKAAGGAVWAVLKSQI